MAEPSEKSEQLSFALSFFPSVAQSGTHHHPSFYHRTLHQFSLLSFSTKLAFTMVAIPTALLASTIVSKLPNFGSLNAAVRHYENTVTKLEAPPIVTRDDTPLSPFESVLGPVVDLNFPDPSIIHIGGVSYAFATNNRGYGGEMIHVQMATSTDNQTWTYLQGQDAMPGIGTWATGGRVWAPDVIQLVRAIHSQSTRES